MWPPPVSTVPDTRQLEICTAGLPRKLVLATVGEMGVAMMCVASQRGRGLGRRAAAAAAAAARRARAAAGGAARRRTRERARARGWPA
jgi:hypothetical protein